MGKIARKIVGCAEVYVVSRIALKFIRDLYEIKMDYGEKKQYKNSDKNDTIDADFREVYDDEDEDD